MWTVMLTDYFDCWLAEQDEDMQEKVFASLGNLEVYGPKLSRPYADTIKGSRYPNMKELRVQHTGKPIRAFFAFDPKRQAIILCAGIKVMTKNFIQR